MTKMRLLRSCLFCIAILLFAIGSSAWAEPVSREAQKHMNRGMAAAEMANSPAEYEEAIREFEQAVSFAPGWPAPYFNLGCVQKEAGKYQESLDNYRKYLELAPNAPDAEQVQIEIDQIEYKMEKKEKEEQILNKALLANGADVNARDKDGRTALMKAAYEGRTENVEVLLANGADINATDNGATILMLASCQGHTETLKVLLANGADVNMRGNHGTTALMNLFVLARYPEIVKILLDNGLDVNARDTLGLTALMLAVNDAEANPEIVKMLLAYGADVNVRNKLGGTALMDAKGPEIIRLLKLAGARE